MPGDDMRYMLPLVGAGAVVYNPPNIAATATPGMTSPTFYTTTGPAPEHEAGGGHPEYLKVLDEMRELHIRKAADYGGDSDPLLNIRAGAELVGIPAWQGAMLRANDKVVRIKQFIKKGTLRNEGVEDSLLDLAAYALLALVLFREGKQ